MTDDQGVRTQDPKDLVEMQIIIGEGDDADLDA